MPTKKPPVPTPGRPVLQWVMATIGAVISLSAIGIIVWEALQPAAAPTLSAQIVAVQATPAGQVATIKVINDGDDTAAGVEIEAMLDGRTSTATLDYVPGHGHAKAYLQFDADPREATVAVKGWSAP